MRLPYRDGDEDELRLYIFSQRILGIHMELDGSPGLTYRRERQTTAIGGCLSLLIVQVHQQLELRLRS